jgi:SAM-dependent methyltransferase
MTVDFASRAFGAGQRRLLDVGCASGTTCREMAAQGHTCVGLEFEAVLATEARALGTAVVRADAGAIPFSNATFDGVLCLEVLEHVLVPEAVLTEAARVLKPGGRLVLAVPTAYTEAVYSRLHPRYLANARHLRVFRKRDLTAILERVGLRPVDEHAAHLGPAIAWLAHAVVRSEADHTGQVLEHQDIDRIVDGVLRRARHVRGLGPVVNGVEARVGKSRYVYAERV